MCTTIASVGYVVGSKEVSSTEYYFVTHRVVDCCINWKSGTSCLLVITEEAIATITYWIISILIEVEGYEAASIHLHGFGEALYDTVRFDFHIITNELTSRVDGEFHANLVQLWLRYWALTFNSSVDKRAADGTTLNRKRDKFWLQFEALSVEHITVILWRSNVKVEFHILDGSTRDVCYFEKCMRWVLR